MGGMSRHVAHRGVIVSLLLGIVCGGCSQHPQGSNNTSENAVPPAEASSSPSPAHDQPESWQATHQQLTNGSETTATPQAAEPGTAAWLIQEIVKLKSQPLTDLSPPQQEAPELTQTAATTDPHDDGSTTISSSVNLEQLRVARRERNLRIIELATQAMAQTAKDEQLQELFETATHHWLDARLQLALQGDEESLLALYDAADTLYRKKQGSSAAAEAQLMVVNLCHALCLRHGSHDSKWVQEFARQARLFATRFPDFEAQTIPLLISAGKSCEYHGLTEEAKSCYSVLKATYPESPQAVLCSGYLRRLSLPGQPLEFAGHTLEGHHLQLDHYLGKAVLIIFWASHVESFREQVPALQALADKYKKYLQVITVSLDSEEHELDQFLEETRWGWPVIFEISPDKRGWNAPLASYYGIQQLPSYWLVDPQGRVVTTRLTHEQIEPRLREVLINHLKGGQSASP